MEESAVHHGRAVTFFRKHDGWTIEQLAKEMEITAPELEALEQQPQWEDQVLHKVSIALDRPYDTLRTFEPAMFEKPNPVVINNTFNDHSALGSTSSVNHGDVTINTYDKTSGRDLDEIKELKDAIDALRKEIEDLKKK